MVHHDNYSLLFILYFQDTRKYVPISYDPMGNEYTQLMYADVVATSSSDKSAKALLDYVCFLAIVLCCLLISVSRFFNKIENEIIPASSSHA